jgi:hypothetical protein
MKARMTTLALAAAFVFASAAFAQQTQSSPTDRKAPQAQQVPDQPEIPTRTAAPSSGQGEIPATTSYTNPNPPAPPAEAQAPAVEAPVALAPAPVAPPAPMVTDTTTTTTAYEELPGSASPFPSIGLGGFALIAAGVLMRRKSE